VTHDANIAVNVGSEYIIAMDSEIPLLNNIHLNFDHKDMKYFNIRT